MGVSFCLVFWNSTISVLCLYQQHLNRGHHVVTVSSGVSVSVATVHQYAMKGLDKMEEKLPILHQPADQVTQKHTTFIVTGTFNQQLKLNLAGFFVWFFLSVKNHLQCTSLRNDIVQKLLKRPGSHIPETVKIAHISLCQASAICSFRHLRQSSSYE